jgi:predicted metal-dependent phosphoesterase TrpH
MLIDLHTHTRRYSWDATLTPDELVDLSRAAGLDGVCLTEHDFFWDHDDVRELSRRHRFLVLPGVEINTEDGHLVCFGLNAYVFGMHRSYELAVHLRRARGVMIAAHPYRRQMPPANFDELGALKALIKATHNPAYKFCAAMETNNGRGTPAENDFSLRVATRYGLPATGASDAHSASDIGKCATEFTRRIDGLDDLIGALKDGSFRPVVLRPPAGITHAD